MMPKMIMFDDANARFNYDGHVELVLKKTILVKNTSLGTTHKIH